MELEPHSPEARGLVAGPTFQYTVPPPPRLSTFSLDDLARFTKEGAFDPRDSPDFRVLYVGRDDVHGALAYVLKLCTRQLKLNMFGYDDDALNAIITGLIDDDDVFVQGTLDKSQSGGVHEKAIIAGWDPKVRASFAIGQSATHQISHTKGGVVDGLVGWEGSTNWSGSGEGTIVAADGSDMGRKAQNNTCAFYVNPVEISKFSAELDEEHAIALQQQLAAAQTLPSAANVCQGCHAAMSLQSEKVYIPGKGNFHAKCAEASA